MLFLKLPFEVKAVVIPEHVCMSPIRGHLESPGEGFSNPKERLKLNCKFQKSEASKLNTFNRMEGYEPHLQK